MIVTTRTRINKIEIENDLGHPTRVIFRTSNLLIELGLEIENPAKVLILDRANNDVVIPGCDITYGAMIKALWGTLGTVNDVELAPNHPDPTPPPLHEDGIPAA